MRTSRSSLVLFMVLLAGAPLCLGAALAAAQARPGGDNQPMPIMETKEVMEYFFEPAYGDLTRAIAQPPADRRAWRTVLTPALKLTELHNLLFFRTDAEYTKKPDWAPQISTNRKLLLDLTAAVRKQDYALTKTTYEAAVAGCNSCHKKFDPDAPLLKAYDPKVEK